MHSRIFQVFLVVGTAAAAQLNQRITHGELFRRQSGSCASSGLAVCESDCMPLDGVCCDDGSSTYCNAGEYCVPGGCCETGETCSGGGGTITNIISGATSSVDTSEPSSTLGSGSFSSSSAIAPEPTSSSGSGSGGFGSGSFSSSSADSSEPTTSSSFSSSTAEVSEPSPTSSSGTSGSGSSSSTCSATQTSCGSGCMPLLATCCDAAQGNYCNSGEYCVSNGCCPVGKTCNGNSKSSSPAPEYSHIGALKLTYAYVLGSLVVAGIWLLQ